MAENMDFRRETDVEGGEEVYSKAVRAGRRTYFFDVKATRNDDYFLTITESRKKQMKDGSFVYDKHKLYLYKEDFAKFSDGLEEVINYIKEHKPEFFRQQEADAQAAPAGVDDEFDRL
ncbi:MAG: PUR family DNA/RNA-binding protein [Alistipes sp.]|nr:PUR family DNA/RNA-binding protein [Alistipes sp.]